jgi:hypothetical protein
MGRPPIGKTAMTSAERVRRHRAKHGTGKPVTKPVTKPNGSDDTENAALKAKLIAAHKEIERLKALASAGKTEAAQPKQQQRAHEATAQQQPIDREALRARMQADHEAYMRECAQWGGRPKRLVIDDIKRLLRGRLHRPDDVTQTIIDTLAPHVRDQANIERGIPRRTFRKVLAELHTDRNPATVAAFIAFKRLDVRDGRKPNPNTIVIADDKVSTTADLRRKREERSERARATAAKRRAAKDNPSH